MIPSSGVAVVEYATNVPSKLHVWSYTGGSGNSQLSPTNTACRAQLFGSVPPPPPGPPPGANGWHCLLDTPYRHAQTYARYDVLLKSGFVTDA